MKKMILAPLAALCFATPALAADFTGPRVGVTAGFADEDFAGFEAFTYGVNVGYDYDLGKVVIGGTLEYQDSEEDGLGRDLSATARIGAKATDKVLVYALGGYTNLSAEGTGIELDGVRVGAGVEADLGKNIFGGIEYRYSDYEFDVDGHQMVLGLGYRF